MLCLKAWQGKSTITIYTAKKLTIGPPDIWISCYNLFMSSVVKIVEKKPKSPEAMVELVRGVIDRLYEEDVTYIEISLKTRSHNSSSISIVSP